VFRIEGAIETPQLRVLAAVLSAGADAVLSHESLAALYGLPGFDLEPPVVSIPRTRRTIPGVRFEQSLALPPHHRRVVDGIPCTSVARLVFDLCGHVRPGRAARALDTALARKLVTMPAAWRVLDDLAERGRDGTVWMRTLLMERGLRFVAPESELEARFVRLVRDASLPQPERQVDIGDADAWIGRVDFLFRDARLVVEVDGAEFHDSLLDRRRDADRDAKLLEAGWTVLRFGWSDVNDRPRRVATSIRGVLYTPGRAQHSPKRAG
jgi:very-short-patch-repair endonuclease